MGNPLVRFWEGQEYDWHMEEILWHRRESRRQTEKTNFFLSSGSLLSTRTKWPNFNSQNLYNPATTRNPLIYLFPENPNLHKILFIKDLGGGQKIDNVFQ